MEMLVNFVKEAKKPGFVMVQVDGEPKQRWCSCATNVQAYAKNNFAEGERVNITYTEGSQWAVTLIKKVGGAAPAPQAPQQTYQAPVTTNLPPVVNTTPVVGTCSVGPKDAAIVSENINGAVAKALEALAGQVSPLNIEEIMRKIYVVMSDETEKNIKRFK